MKNRFKRRRLRVLLMGAGDVATRLARLHTASAQWLGLARSEAHAARLRQYGIVPMLGDLDDRQSLRRVAAIARSSAATAYLAPPPASGDDDPRMRRWLAALNVPRVGKNRPMRPRRTLRQKHRAKLNDVYVSTTGVYGDCEGRKIDETTPVAPQSERAHRRVRAENRLRNARGGRTVILRAPGIYAAERLPIARLLAGTPALKPEDDVFTNHIHADDLAAAVWFAMFRGRAQRVVNVADGADIKMGDYFDTVADALGLKRPPRMSRDDLKMAVSPTLYSFMSESRRIDSRRLKDELGVRLRYDTPMALLKTLKPVKALQRSLDI